MHGILLPMKKRIIIDVLPDAEVLDSSWLDLEALAEVEITSEASDYPIEGALLPNKNHGWKASKSGKQMIKLIFKQAQNIHRIHLTFLECNVVRTQEYVLRWSRDNGHTFSEIVRQQWNFSPDGSTKQSEDHTLELYGVTVLELMITPDISQQNVFASLEQLRVG
jgi:XRCC1 N terminal domain